MSSYGLQDPVFIAAIVISLEDQDMWHPALAVVTAWVCQSVWKLCCLNSSCNAYKFQTMTLRLHHYPRKNTEKQTFWSDGLNYMLNHGLITGYESVLYSPMSRVLSRFETSSTSKFQIIHAPQYAYHMVNEPPNQPQVIRDQAPLTRRAMQSGAADRIGLVDGFNFQRTYPDVHSNRQNDAVGANNNFGFTADVNDDGDIDIDNFANNDNGDYDNSDYDIDDNDDDYDVDNNDEDDNDFADDGDGGYTYENDDDDDEDGDENFDDVADMRLDGLGDTSMSTRASTAIKGSYRDGIEIHKIPDHSMFLRTITHRDIRPILIAEVKRLSLGVTRRPISINDLGHGVFSDVVRSQAKVVISAAEMQVTAQAKCVFGEFGPDSISFINALVVAGPYYQRYFVARPTDGQGIVLEPKSEMKELFDRSLSEITDDFYEDWKDICRSYGLHML